MIAAAQPHLGVSYPHRGLDRRPSNRPTAAGTDPSCRPSSLTPLTSIRRKAEASGDVGKGRQHLRRGQSRCRWPRSGVIGDGAGTGGGQMRGLGFCLGLVAADQGTNERSSRQARVFSPRLSRALSTFFPSSPPITAWRGGRHWIAIARPHSSLSTAPPNSRAPASHSPRPNSRSRCVASQRAPALRTCAVSSPCLRSRVGKYHHDAAHASPTVRTVHGPLSGPDRPLVKPRPSNTCPMSAKCQHDLPLRIIPHLRPS